MAKMRSNRIAMAIICDETDNILMGVRNDSGKWTAPGGHLGVKEDPFEGLARELKEETGLDAKTMKLCCCTKKDNKIIYVMKVTVDPDQKIDVSGDPDKECDDWEYKNPCDIAEELHVPLEHNVVLRAWMDN